MARKDARDDARRGPGEQARRCAGDHARIRASARPWPRIGRVAATWVMAAGIALAAAPAANGQVPDGFTPIFNGEDLAGWHASRTTHHGSTPNATVEDGALVLRQFPFGQGGLLLTDARYRNFELYLETQVPWGINSGIFFRSTEGGSAYQIELIGGGTGNTAGLLSEAMPIGVRASAPGLADVWKEDDWNSFRLRVEGDAPRITLWVNGVEMWQVQQEQNDKIAGETDGHIGLQVHWSHTYTPIPDARCCPTSWKPDAALMFRNIAIRELP